MYACAICGKLTVGDERWLLMVENRWQDRLKILHWDNPIATMKGVKVVCGAEQAREIVVHWMTTGSMAYPFCPIDEGWAEGQEKRAPPECRSDLVGRLGSE